MGLPWAVATEPATRHHWHAVLLEPQFNEGGLRTLKPSAWLSTQAQKNKWEGTLAAWQIAS
jgi:hypothetical protein